MMKWLLLYFVFSVPAFAEGSSTSNDINNGVLADTISADLKSNPLVDQNKAVADFAELVVSKSFTQAKAVRKSNGVTIVDVIILDKLCHVTVDESSEKLRANKIECDEGRYFPSSITSS